MTSLANIPQGVFGPQAVAAIQQAINQAGLGTTGNIYYCDPVNGLDVNNGQSVSSAVKTIAAGHALMAQGNNDVLVLIGNGAASGSARITSFIWSKNACHLIGVCAPSAVSQRARIANPTTAGLVITANFFTLSANGCLFQNLSFFQGAGAGQTGIAAAILVTITGSRNVFRNVDFEGMGDAVSAADAGSRCLLISGGGQENLFQHCNLGLDTVARTNANATVEIAGGGPRNIFEDCTFPFDSTDGLQYALLGNAAAALDRWVLFRRCGFFSGVGTIIAQLFHLAAAVGGLLYLDNGCFWHATATGDATTQGQLQNAGVAGAALGGQTHAG